MYILAIGRRHARPSFRAAFHPLEHDELYVHNLIRSATNSHRSFSSKSKDKGKKKIKNIQFIRIDKNVNG
jgi:hypothetical protein